MSGTKKAIIVIILIFVIGMFISPLIYVETNKIIYKNKVITYLIEAKGYKKEEIKFVQSGWGNELTPFYAVVIFENEPYVEYIYFAHNEIMQFEYRLTVEGKQKGITENDLKNYESSY